MASYEPDNAGPGIQIRTPAQGAEYVRGRQVPADFECADAGAGIESCVGTVADGAAMDMQIGRDQVFRVTATDNAGNVTTRSVTYSVLSSEEDGEVGGEVPPTLSRCRMACRPGRATPATPARRSTTSARG